MPGEGDPTDRGGEPLMRGALLRRALALLLAALLLCPLLAGCGERVFRASVSEVGAFDTVSTLTVYAESQRAADEGAARLREELLLCHRLFDTYRSYEGVTNLHDLAEAEEPLALESPVIHLLTEALALGNQSGGAVSPLYGGLTRLWQDFMKAEEAEPGSGVLPTAEQIASALAKDGGSLSVDPERYTVTLTKPQAGIDVGAFAKGYAGQLLAGSAAQLGLLGAVIDLGGNITLYGTHPQGRAWQVDVASPEGGVAFRLSLAGGVTVSTAGDYQRYVERDGVRYHHIIDPTTGYPATRYRAVTVIAADGLMADGLATALFLLSEEEGATLAASYGAEVHWTRADGSTRSTDGFAALVEK